MSAPPAGLRAAPLSTDDAADITRVWRTCEEYDDDRAEMTREDIVAGFKRPSLLLERDAIGVRSEWPEYEGESFEDWRAECLGRPGFAPDLLALAVRGEEIAGAAALIEDSGEGWVSHLAVARGLCERVRMRVRKTYGEYVKRL